jgi:hypothetical protein
MHWRRLVVFNACADFGAVNLSPQKKNYFQLRPKYIPGDLDFDPLGLKPEDPEEFKEMQTKELQHCRLAMLAAAGMIVQELQMGATLF